MKFLGQGFPVKSWLSLNLLCRSGWPETQEILLPMLHYFWLYSSFIILEKNCTSSPSLQIMMTNHLDTTVGNSAASWVAVAIDILSEYGVSVNGFDVILNRNCNVPFTSHWHWPRWWKPAQDVTHYSQGHNVGRNISETTLHFSYIGWNA